jgi:GT2 family glycosyltransferase
MVSIIVVTYKVKKQLLECLNSIYKSKPKTEFEIIVVNNGDEDRLEETLGKNFPKEFMLKAITTWVMGVALIWELNTQEENISLF